MNNQAFDLSKMDYRAARLHLRKRLLVLSIVPLVILALIGAWLCAVYMLNAMARNANAHQQFSSANSYMNAIKLPAPEAFVIIYNRATIKSQNGQFEAAEADYVKALAIAPSDKECMVRVNYELSTEASAQKALNSGNYQDALTKLQKSLSMLNAAPKCFKLNEAKQRIEDARQQAQSSQSNKNDQKTDTTNAPVESAPSNEQQQELQKAEQKAAQTARERNNNFEGNTDYNQSKPW